MPEPVRTDATDQLGVQRLLDIVRAINNLTDAFSGAAPVDSPFVIYTADATLTSARVTTDSATIDWSIAVAGEISASVDQTANFSWTGTHTFSISPRPSSNGAASLGISGTAWANLFLSTGGVINWNAGDVTITHSANVLSFAGASLGYNFDAFISPSTNDAAALGTSAVSWSDLFLAATGVINWGAGDVTITHATNNLLFAGASSGYTFDAIVYPTTNAAVPLGDTTHNWSSLFLGLNAVINWNNGDVTLTHAANSLAFAGASSGYSFDAEIFPAANDGAALGDATHNFSDLFLASGAIINWNAGDVTLTHAANNLLFAGATSGYTFDAKVYPTTDAAVPLGDTTHNWSNFFLGLNAVINWNNGDVTLTHSANRLAFAGASSGYSFDAEIFPAADGGAALGDVTHNFSNLFLAASGVINWANGDVTITNSTNLLAFAGASSGYTFDSLMVVGSTANLSIGGNADSFEVLGTTAATGGSAIAMFNTVAGTAAHLDFYRSKNAAIGSATVVASGDNLGQITWFGAQQTGTFATQTNAAQIRVEVDGAVTSGASGDMPGRIVFATTADGSGTLTDRVTLDSAAAFKPSSNDGVTLGVSGTAWGDLFLASGGVINWNAGDVLITHSSNTLAFTGASSGYTFDAAVQPSANDSAALGLSGTAWSDLFLASGGVINWGAGNVTATHSTSAISWAGVSAFSATAPAATTMQMSLAGDSGQTRQFEWRTGTSARWIARMDNTAESGSNAGSNFSFLARDDSSAALFTVWSVVRSTGVVTFPQNTTFSADISAATVSGAAVATQANQETGTATNLIVTPGRQAFHPSASKVWSYVTVSGGTPTQQVSFNMTSITDTLQGRLTFTIATDFSSANYASSLTVEAASNATAVANRRFPCIANAGQAAGTYEGNCWDGTATNSVLVDPASWSFIAFGDQA